MRSCKRGFTLVELLVAIAIILVLAAIVFTVLATARNRGKAARIQAETVELRTHIEYGYTGLKYSDLANGVVSSPWAGQDTFGTVNWTTTGAALKTLKDDIAAQGQVGNLKIYESGTALNNITAYAIYVYYPNSLGGYCLDSTGANKSNYAGVAAFTAGSPAPTDYTTCAASTGL